MGGEEGVEGRRKDKVEGRPREEEGKRRKQKEGTCVWVRERNGEKEKERGKEI